MAAAAATLLLLGGWATSRRPPVDASARIGQMSDLEQRDVQIAVWRQALAADSSSAIALGQLAGLYMQRARESGDESNYLEAGIFARRSVSERAQRNGAAFVTLASALLAQHRFAEADSIITVLTTLEPEVAQYRAIAGEIKLETGDYPAAKTAFDSLSAYRTHLSIAPRLARWMEINGNDAAARRLYRDALAEVKTRRDIPREQAAWFYLRAGELELRTGRFRAALAAFREGMALEPNDHRLLAAMAKLELLRGRPRKAIELGELAVAIKLDPATLGIVGDAYAAVADSPMAAKYVAAMETAVASQPGTYHRTWSLLLLDHDRQVDNVLKKAESELTVRRDVYGYDVLAWALHKAGRNPEALAAMQYALRMGTRDAVLHYHDGMIRHALRDFDGARRALELAIEINPRFHHVHAARARQILEEIRHR